MKHAQFITSLTVAAPNGETEIAVYFDPESGGVFGLDASFVDQVGAVVMNPMQNSPEFLVLGEDGGGEVDQESLAEFIEQMDGHPIIMALKVLTALYHMENKAGEEGEWIGNALYRRLEAEGIGRAQLGLLLGLANGWLKDLKSGLPKKQEA